MTDMAFSQSPAATGTVKDYWSLLKPRVMSLVVFTGICGLLLAPGQLHPLLGLAAILAISVGAGASGAINMWYERDIDSLMKRTQSRPLPQGKVAPEEALTFGVVLTIMAVVLLALATNYIAAFWLAIASAFYVFVYTIWLKRRTPQNIVIGGAAGAFPPVIGWAAVTGTTPVEAWLLFALIFFWTPPHFWALALFSNADYARAGVPMLPVVKGRRHTQWQMLAYTLLMLPLSVAPTYIGMASNYYAYAAAGLSLIFIGHAVRVLKTDSDKHARSMFTYSILYLFLLFAGLLVDHILPKVMS